MSESSTEAGSPFGGRIGTTWRQSQPWWPQRRTPGKDAPDVVVVLLDDVGFGSFGCYGAEIDTPTIDRLAAAGLRYNNFHVTPLCSPTRASLLTGRNHHSVGMAFLANADSGFPNSRGHVTHEAATIAEVLRAEGYGTFCVGKWHLAPIDQTSAAGSTISGRSPAASSAITASSTRSPTTSIPISSTTITGSIRRGRPSRATT